MFNHTANDPIFKMVTSAAQEASEAWAGSGVAGPFGDDHPISFPHWLVSTPFGDCGIAWLEWDGEQMNEMRTVCIAAVDVPVSAELYEFVATDASESTWANLHVRRNQHSDVVAVVVTSSIWSDSFYGMVNNEALDATIFNAIMPVLGWGHNWGEKIRSQFGGSTWHWDGSSDGQSFMRVVGFGLL